MTRKEVKREVTRCYDIAVTTVEQVVLDLPVEATMRAWTWSSYGIRLELELPTISMQIKTWEIPRKQTIKAMTGFLMTII